MGRIMKVIVILLIVLSASTGSYILGVHFKDSKQENEYAYMTEEIVRLKESEHKAIVERNRAENENESLKAENDSMNDTLKRYKNQLEAMKKENENLKSEVDRLTKKLNNSLLRIANPFK